MIELKRVSFGYGDRSLFQGVNLVFSTGDIVLVQGKSGCGKTSFLYLLNRFRLPLTGGIFLDGRPYAQCRYEELRSRVVYLHQSPVMMSGLTVLDSLFMPFSFSQNQGGRVPGKEELEPMLTEFHLEPKILDRDAESLSVGEQQRVAILRACLLKPDFLLMDEPLANLDRDSAGAIQEWIAQQSRQETGLVVVSHQPLENLPQGAVRFLEFAEGRVNEHGH